MCGKFTALASWSEVVAFSQPLTESGGGEGPSGDEGSNDEIVTYRVGGLLPVIVWDAETRARRVVKMRWGFPDPRDWRRPRPIHARSETIDGKEPFRTPFHAGQRGIVIFRTFNEGEEVVKPSGRTETRQWTIDPRDGQPRGFAFVWRRFKISACGRRCHVPIDDRQLEHVDSLELGRVSYSSHSTQMAIGLKLLPLVVIWFS